MRSYNSNYSDVVNRYSTEPRFTIRLDFADTFLDPIYFTSHSDSATPPGAVVYASTFITGSSVSQNIEKSFASIGSISLELLDSSNAITSIFGSRLNVSDKGLRLKRVRVYKGFSGLVWADYEIVSTQLIGSLSYDQGKYILSCDDIQRTAKKDIFDVKETELSAAITISATTATVLATTGFSTVSHGTAYSDSPSATVGYIQVDDEIIKYTSTSASQFLTLTRGVLGTTAAAHESGAKVSEIVYLELPVIKLIYGILLGDIYGQAATFPAHWHLGIDATYVDGSAFTGLGVDLWDTADDTAGAVCRFIIKRKEDAKQFIERELLPLAGCIMTVMADGRYSIRRRAQVLETSPADLILDDTNIISHSPVMYDYSRCRNQIEVEWNWSNLLDDYTRKNTYLFTDSITKYKATPVERIKFRGLYGERHTQQNIARVVEYLADRLAYPPITVSAELLPNLEVIEVGDVVRFSPSGIYDHTSIGAAYVLDRSFEVLRVSTDLITGKVSVDLSSSSQPSPLINYIESSTVVDSAYYTAKFAAGTNVTTLAGYSAGALTANVSFTGGSTLATGILYRDGDLTINSGVTLTISSNVWLIVKGHLTINGTISGVGGGRAGISSSTLTEGTGNSGGYLGRAQAMGGIIVSGVYQPTGEDPTFLWWQGQSKGGAYARSRYGQSAPVLNLINTGTDIEGVSYHDLRGTGGAAGGAVHLVDTNNGSGSAGGAGGAGLMILSRGVSLGVSAEIDLSGTAGTATSTGPVYVINGSTNTGIVYPGSGSGGLPGCMYVLLDGTSAVVPDLTNQFTALRGACPAISGASHLSISGRNFYAKIGQTAVASGFRGDAAQHDYYLAATRIQYIPENETPIADNLESAPLPPTSPALVSGNAELDTRTDGTVIERVKATWTASTDTNVDRYWVEAKKASESEHELVATLLSRTATTAYISKYKALDVIDVRIAAVNKFDKRSTWATVTGHTVAGKSAAPTAVTGATVTPISQAMRVTITAAQQCPDRDLAAIEIWYHTANDRNAVATANKITVPAKPGMLWESLVPATVGTTYYFWFRPIDTSGLTGTFYPSGATSGLSAAGILSVKNSSGNLLIGGDGGGALQTMETGFRETFEHADALTLWENYEGSGELSIVSVTDSLSGGKVLRVGNNSGNDQAWLIHKNNIPFDQNKLYKITVVLRRTSGTGTVYAGWAGVAADGTTLVNISGANDYGSQHYHAVTAGAPGASLTTYVGYTRGVAATGTNVAGTLSTPGVMHQDVRYIRPLLLVNYNAQAGQVDVDSFTVELGADATLDAIESGIDLGVGYLQNGSNIKLDFANKAISINSATFGALGIQAQYNSGTPRIYVGDAGNKFWKFTGTEVEVGRDVILRGTYSYNNNALYFYEQWRSIDGYALTTAGDGATPVLTGTGGDTINLAVSTGSSGTASFSRAISNLSSSARMAKISWGSTVRFKTRLRVQVNNVNCYFRFGVSSDSQTRYVYFVAEKDGTGMRFGVRWYDATTTTTTYATGTYNQGTNYTIEVIFEPATSIVLLVDESSVLTVTANLPSGVPTATEVRLEMGDTTLGAKGDSYAFVGDYKIEKVA